MRLISDAFYPYDSYIPENPYPEMKIFTEMAEKIFCRTRGAHCPAAWQRLL